MSSRKQLDALTETACKSGKTVDSFGEGHSVTLLRHGGLWVVIENDDDENGNVEPFTDETDAREAFAEIKEEIENEQTEE